AHSNGYYLSSAAAAARVTRWGWASTTTSMPSLWCGNTTQHRHYAKKKQRVKDEEMANYEEELAELESQAAGALAGAKATTSATTSQIEEGPKYTGPKISFAALIQQEPTYENIEKLVRVND